MEQPGPSDAAEEPEAAAVEDLQDLELRRERDALRASLGRVGAWSFALETMPAAEERDAAAQIESFGYRAIWVPEAVDSREAFAHAGWLLASTERAIVATGIANIWARDPTATANGWRMLSDAYPERFLLGIGVSHQGSVARRGAVYERPLSAMREYLDAMDRAPVHGARTRDRAAPRAGGPRTQDARARGRASARRASVLRSGRAHGVRAAASRPGPVLAVEQTVVLESDPSRARDVARGSPSITCRPRTTRGTSGGWGGRTRTCAGRGATR